MGAAPNIIQGLALGYMSTVVPIACLTVTIAYGFATAGMYGVGLSALGMLGSLPVALTIDGYGPISDNAGGIAEMSGLPGTIRDRTDELDAAGNTTAAIGKGFAIGSATLVGLALFGAFITRSGLTEEQTSILSPMVFACLLLGAMIPYWFTAMTMKSVGVAANQMVLEVSRQFSSAQAVFPCSPDALTDDMVKEKMKKLEFTQHKAFEKHMQCIRDDDAPEDWNIRRNGDSEVEINLIMAKLVLPMNAKCISISTDASLREMVPP